MALTKASTPPALAILVLFSSCSAAKRPRATKSSTCRSLHRGGEIGKICVVKEAHTEANISFGSCKSCNTTIDTFNDKQSQTAERKSGDGRGPGDHSSEAG